MIPAWLGNLEWLMASPGIECERNRYIADLAVLQFFAPMIGRWLDAHLVNGQPAHEAIARRAAAIWQQVGIDWPQLPPDDRWDGVQQIDRRFRGLGLYA